MFEHVPYTTIHSYVVQTKQIFYGNLEAFASELLEDIEDMLPYFLVVDREQMTV